MSQSPLNDTLHSVRETTLAAAHQVGEGFGHATIAARSTNQGIHSFREAVRDQPLIMAFVMLSVGYFLRTILYPSQHRR